LCTSGAAPGRSAPPGKSETAWEGAKAAALPRRRDEPGRPATPRTPAPEPTDGSPRGARPVLHGGGRPRTPADVPRCCPPARAPEEPGGPCGVRAHRFVGGSGVPRGRRPPWVGRVARLARGPARGLLHHGAPLTRPRLVAAGHPTHPGMLTPSQACLAVSSPVARPQWRGNPATVHRSRRQGSGGGVRRPRRTGAPAEPGGARSAAARGRRGALLPGARFRPADAGAVGPSGPPGWRSGPIPTHTKIRRADFSEHFE